MIHRVWLDLPHGVNYRIIMLHQRKINNQQTDSLPLYSLPYPYRPTVEDGMLHYGRTGYKVVEKVGDNGGRMGYIKHKGRAEKKES